MTKPELLSSRPLRPDEFHFAVPTTGAAQLTGYGRIGHGILPSVDMTVVLPDGLLLSVVSVEVNLPTRSLQRPFVSVSFAPLQPGEVEQARAAMKALGWTVAAADEAEPSDNDLALIDDDAQAEGDDDDEPAPAPIAKPRAKAPAPPAKPVRRAGKARR